MLILFLNILHNLVNVPKYEQFLVGKHSYNHLILWYIEEPQPEVIFSALHFVIMFTVMC